MNTHSMNTHACLRRSPLYPRLRSSLAAPYGTTSCSACRTRNLATRRPSRLLLWDPTWCNSLVMSSLASDSSCVGCPICWQSMSEDGISDYVAAIFVSYIGIEQAHGCQVSFSRTCVCHCIQAMVNARAGLTASTHTMLQLASHALRRG